MIFQITGMWKTCDNSLWN